jgi:hypothetical protein
MHALPEFFNQINDPHRAQGRRHPLPAVLAVATATVLCRARTSGPLSAICYYNIKVV